MVGGERPAHFNGLCGSRRSLLYYGLSILTI